MARVFSERNATSLAGPERFTDLSASTGPHQEHGEPCRLLRWAAELLSKGDLKGASETLKEASRILASRGENDWTRG